MRSELEPPFALHGAVRSHTKSNAVNIAGMRSAWKGSPPDTGKALSSTRLVSLSPCRAANAWATNVPYESP